MAQPLMFLGSGTKEPATPMWSGLLKKLRWLRVKLMRRVRNGLITLGALAAIGTSAAPSDEAAPAAPSSTALLTLESEASSGQLAGLPEEAAMLLVGTALIGVAAAVRRAA